VRRIRENGAWSGEWWAGQPASTRTKTRAEKKLDTGGRAVAREFKHEFTIYLWPQGNPLYPHGHAAFKVSNDKQKRFFNRNIDVDTVDGLNRHFDEYERMRTQRLRPGAPKVRYDFKSASPLYKRLEDNAVENRNVEHTAQTKIKIPFCGAINNGAISSGTSRTGSGSWGIQLREMSEFERPNVPLRMVRSSCAYVGQILELAGASAFAPPPYSTMLRWDPPILERWARSVRARIDELNQKSDWIERYITDGHGTFNMVNRLKNLSKQNSILTAQEWRDLCNEYWPSSFIQSGRRKRLDKLVQDLPSLRGKSMATKVQALTETLEICKDYADEYYRQNKPRHAIPSLVLGRQLRYLAEDGLHDLRGVL
jgi:hypothetical protein